VRSAAGRDLRRTLLQSHAIRKSSPARDAEANPICLRYQVKRPRLTQPGRCERAQAGKIRILEGGSEIEVSQTTPLDGLRRSVDVLDHPRRWVRWMDFRIRPAAMGLQNLSSLSPLPNRNEGREVSATEKGMGRGERLPAERNLLMERNVPPVSMVRRPSPYADIPSLYDMYVQASGRESTQERFGLKIFRNNSLEPDAIPMDLPVGLNMWLDQVMAWRLIFGEAFRSACFELWIAKGASRCRKRGPCW